VSLVGDSSEWGAISITESLRKVPVVIRTFYRVKRALKKGTPGVFVPIDFGYMNIRLARHAKNHGWKVLYFVPPGSWRKDKQGKDLPAITDAIVTPFAWSAELLNQMGAKAFWFGHPLLELITQGGQLVRRGIAVLPGSRDQELRELIPVFAEALKGEAVTLALAPATDAAQIAGEWKRLAGVQPEIIQGDAARALQGAELALVCSGTATLEAAICGTPMVVAYRVSKAVQREAKLIRFKIPRRISLPNILLDEDPDPVPELVHDRCTPEAIRREVAKLRADPDRQREAFARLVPILGERHAISWTADLIRQMVGREASE
jgi:lipid-A-disaccharide synthase